MTSNPNLPYLRLGGKSFRIRVCSNSRSFAPAAQIVAYSNTNRKNSEDFLSELRALRVLRGEKHACFFGWRFSWLGCRRRRSLRQFFQRTADFLPQDDDVEGLADEIAGTELDRFGGELLGIDACEYD